MLNCRQEKRYVNNVAIAGLWSVSGTNRTAYTAYSHQHISTPHVCVMGSYCSPVGAGSSCLWLGEWGQSCGWLGWCRSSSSWLTLAWQESRAARCISAPLSGFKNRGQDLTQILGQRPTFSNLIWDSMLESCKWLICCKSLSKHSAGWYLFYFCSRLNIETESLLELQIGQCLS